METSYNELIPNWQSKAQCVGTDQVIFFPSDKYYEGSPRWVELVSIAKSVCKACLVRADCLDYALTTRQEEGVWGGLTPRERGRVRKNDALAG